jgi:glucose/arabinose dehydrogenase
MPRIVALLVLPRGRRAAALIAALLMSLPQTALAQGEGDRRAPQGGEVGLELLGDGLVSPVFLIESPDDSGRLFVVDQAGQIRILSELGEPADVLFLDLKDKLVELNPQYDERGLLGLAFHPDFANNRRFFVYYSGPRRESAPADWSHTGRLSEFTVSQDNSNLADKSSERVVLEVDKPQADHNGGHIAFGPDGFLYVPLGDGGGANDTGIGHSPQGNAQDVSNLLGDILRIDVNGAPPYGIPPDNPFVGRPEARPEIFANGFRNPSHLSFDRGGSNELLVSDAGQDRFEEVSLVTKGGNFGWRIKEGTHCFNVDNPVDPLPSCPSTGPFGEPLIDPVIEYSRLEILGSTVVGGYIYRGNQLPDLVGKYVFGDSSRDRGAPDGTLFAFNRSQSGLWAIQELRPHLESEGIDGSLKHFVLGFGQDRAGEVYLLAKTESGPTGATGKVFRIVRREPAAPEAEEPSGGRMSPWIWAGLGVIFVLAFFTVSRRTKAGA